jgi:hypothetical protein
MLEGTDALINEVLESITFVLVYLTVFFENNEVIAEQACVTATFRPNNVSRFSFVNVPRVASLLRPKISSLEETSDGLEE